MEIRKFVIVSSGNIFALNGASKFVKMFYDNESYFDHRGIALTVISNSEGFSDQQIYVKSAKYKVKKFIKSLLSKTHFGERAKFKISLRQSQKVAHQISTVENDTCYLLNDYHAAYAFLEIFPTVKHAIFMMHNDGDLLSMMDSRMLNDRRIYNKLLLMEKTIFEKAEKIVFVAEKAKRNFIEKYNQYSHKAITIYNGLPREEDKKIEERQFDWLQIVCVGTLGERKNQKLLIDAVKAIGDPTIKATLVGGGEVQFFKDYVKKSALENNIEVVGSQRDVAAFLRNSNLFVLSSLNEGLPISAQEAMGFGLPLILTNVGGCSELINGNGILIEPQLNQLVEALNYYNKNKKMLLNHGKESMQLFSEKFEMRKMFDNYIKAINEL